MIDTLITIAVVIGIILFYFFTWAGNQQTNCSNCKYVRDFIGDEGYCSKHHPHHLVNRHCICKDYEKGYKHNPH